MTAALEPVDPRLVAVIEEAIEDANQASDHGENAPQLIAERVWQWLAEGAPT